MIARILAMLFVVLLLPSPAFAQAGDAVTHHVLDVAGRTLHYTARAGTITLYDDKNQATNAMFFTAYTLDGADPATRPITFFYNGGPGGSSVWQRMAAFGPVRVIGGRPGGETPAAPYRVVDNEYSLLDRTDEVYIDAPATGFSRLLPHGKASETFGVDQDAAAFAQFIRRFLSDYGRWNSPKYLFGESYGTIRTAAVAHLMESGFGQAVQFNGVVLMSSALNVDLLWDDVNVGGNDWPFVLFLPTEAATAYHYHLAQANGESLQSFLATVEHFALTQYLTTLAAGDDASAAQRDAVVQRLHEFLGLSPQLIRDDNLRIRPNDFRSDLLRGSGQIVGYMDTRYTGYDTVGGRQAPAWDTSDLATSPAVIAVFNDYVRDELGYRTNLEYLPLTDVLGAWSWQHQNDVGGDSSLLAPPNTILDLSEAMAENPRMRVFAAEGYFDMSTPFFQQDYDFAHLHLPPALRDNLTIEHYESGHMVYFDPESLARIKADLDRWYDAR